MKSEMFISTAELKTLAGNLLKQGTAVIGPSPGSDGQVEYRRIADFDHLDLKGNLPRRSIKEFFLPATEPLVDWHDKKEDVEVKPATIGPQKRVILGAKPCDAAALTIMDKVMDWDYHDDLWFKRRENTTVVSLACPGVDKSCFCTAVGLSPDSNRGADILLVPVEGGYHAEILTDKGLVLTKENPGLFKEGGKKEAAKAFADKAKSAVASNLSVSHEKLRPWLAQHFEDSMWTGIALRCHGCGACAFNCPTCHCFDIVDEPEGITRGTRRRNWDTCQTAKFTLHGSGHNPRIDQNSRIRQRVMHKFCIYPERFKETLCTGCGRCIRVCSAGMDLIEILEQVGKAAQGSQKGAS